MAPPPVMNQTWLPSQCGPTVLMTTRRSSSFLADEGQQRAHAHVVAVHDGEADQQHAHQQPPDDLEGRVVDHVVSPLARR
jgi:hypothetical protein